jgi:branched-chain amino acid transport system ATP-binding protein
VAELTDEADAPADEVAPADGQREATRLLELSQVTMRFGGVTALRTVDLVVDEGEILGLIGPNGAGKTTVFNVVTGVFRPTEGTISLGGRHLAGMRPHEITAQGVARTFQNIRLFPNMTAMENVLVGTDARHGTSVPGAIAHVPRHRREEQQGQERALELLDFMGIRSRVDEYAKNLSYGDQRRLEIARALATDPRLLLLDEPAAGFNPNEKRALMTLIGRVRDQGYTVLLIEHDMGLVMGVCDRVAVLDFGEKIAEGPPSAIQTDQRVIDAYLGVPSDAAGD